MKISIYFLQLNEETNDLNRDLANFGNSSAYSCRTNSFPNFYRVQKHKPKTHVLGILTIAFTIDFI